MILKKKYGIWIPLQVSRGQHEAVIQKTIIKLEHTLINLRKSGSGDLRNTRWNVYRN